jgi:hypothetical protein
MSIHFVTREIVGHESVAISGQYPHLSTDDKRRAIRNLPDVMNDEAGVLARGKRRTKK